MKHLETAREVIAALDGLDAVAARTDRAYVTVSEWQVKDRFPPEFFLLMTGDLAERGFIAPARLWRQVERHDDTSCETAAADV